MVWLSGVSGDDGAGVGDGKVHLVNAVPCHTGIYVVVSLWLPVQQVVMTTMVNIASQLLLSCCCCCCCWYVSET